jgi:hypothetical protein
MLKTFSLSLAKKKGISFSKQSGSGGGAGDCFGGILSQTRKIVLSAYNFFKKI